MKSKESDRQTAERLTDQLGFAVTRGMLRYWRKRSFNLSDVTVLRHNLRNLQKSRPGFTATSRTTASKVPGIAAEAVPTTIAELESQLIAAPDFETARTISTKLSGLKNAHRLRSEMAQFVTRQSVERERLLVDRVFSATVLKMPTELPQMIIGENYAEAVKRCDDYAYGILLTVSSPETYE